MEGRADGSADMVGIGDIEGVAEGASVGKEDGINDGVALRVVVGIEEMEGPFEGCGESEGSKDGFIVNVG